MPKLRRNVIVAYSRVSTDGGVLCRQSSDTEEAISKGGGYIYFTSRRKISPVAGREMIEKEIVKPVADGLFDGSSQTFRAIPFAEFDAFQERNEAV